jgi:hypothetical protein
VGFYLWDYCVCRLISEKPKRIVGALFIAPLLRFGPLVRYLYQSGITLRKTAPQRKTCEKPPAQYALSEGVCVTLLQTETIMLDKLTVAQFSF